MTTRRRIALLLAAVLVTAGVVGVVLVGRDDPGRTPSKASPASKETAQKKSAQKKSARAEPAVFVPSDIAGYGPVGGLYVDKDATVLERLDNPLGVEPPHKSVALKLSREGIVYYFVAYYDPDGGAQDTDVADEVEGSFVGWVHREHYLVPKEPHRAPDGHVTIGDPTLGLVEFVGDTERLRGLRGATVDEQIPGVRVGERFASVDDDTAVAGVTTRDGLSYWVVARRGPDQPAQYIAVFWSNGGRTMDMFLQGVRALYAEPGPGLL